MAVPERHFVSGNRLSPPFPAGLQLAMLGMGCFWGAERLFWELPGVYSTAAGYAGGFTGSVLNSVCEARTRLFHGGGRRLRRTTDAVGKSVLKHLTPVAA